MRGVACNAFDWRGEARIHSSPTLTLKMGMGTSGGEQVSPP